MKKYLHMNSQKQKKLLNKIKNLEQLGKLILKDAATIRMELEHGNSGSPTRGDEIASEVIAKRTKSILK